MSSQPQGKSPQIIAASGDGRSASAYIGIMATRLPNTAIRPPAREAALGALEAEVLNEKVESLGRAGRQAQQALAALSAFAGEPGSAGHEALLDAAAAKVWAFTVQRELCGFRDTRMIAEDLAVPREVMVRLGVVPKGR